MKIKHKLMLGVGGIVLLFVMVGFFGLMANRLIIQSIEGDYLDLRDIVSSATAIGSIVKRAESHLMLYLALHEQKDLAKHQERLAQLQGQLQALEKKIRHIGARELLEALMVEYEKFVPYCSSLLAAHERDMQQQGSFDVAQYAVPLRRMHGVSSTIRDLGDRLAKLETDFLNRQEAISAAHETSSYVKRAEGHLLLYLLLHDEEDRKKFYARNDSLQEQIQVLEGRLNVSRNKDVLRELKAHAAALLPAGEELLLLHDQEMAKLGFFTPAPHKERFWQLYEVVSSIRVDAEKLMEFSVDLEVERHRLISEKALENKRYLVAVVVVAVGLSLLLGLYLTRSIVFPLRQLQAAVKGVQDGNFDVVLESRGRDEFGILAKNFQQMARTLRETTTSKNYVDSIISSMAEGLMVIGRDGTIRTVNKSLCAMTGFAEHEIMNASLHDFNPFGGPFKEKWVYEELIQSELQNVEDIFLARDGRHVPILFSAKPIHDMGGNFVGIVCVVQDISRIKEAEEIAVKAEVKRATASAEALAAVGELTSSIVHEMRNPLSSIQMNIEALRARVEGDPVYAEMADISLQQAERLAQMLSDLLQHGKPMALNIKPVTAGQLITESLLALGDLAETKGISVSFDDAGNDIVLPVDKELMVRALSNIVDNCLYWTPERGAIRIAVAQNIAKQEVAISITDTGPGIPEEVFKTMFKPFVTMRKEGTGLGLANVKKIVDCHNGQVFAENTGTGARFTIRLPKRGFSV